nr:hypothetical protein [Leptospira barantonii]
MPLPFPEELGTPLNESASVDEKTKETASGNTSASIPSEKNESSGTNPNSSSQSETKATNVSSSGSAESGSTEKSGTDSSVEASVASSGNSEISEQESAKPAIKTTLPNSEKSSLKKKKDKKKEDPSESGYKKGLLRLRENQRNNAKTEFNQSGGQGKSANASRLEDARLTAESSNDSNAITEQIDSEDEKWKAIFEVARALRGNGKISEAETQYLKIITEAPENFQSISLLSLGEMLSSTDRKDSGRRYLLQLVKLLQKKPELDPKKDQLEKAVTMIARIYGDQGKYEEAENWAKAYLNRMNPEASEDSPFVKELRRILKRRYY